MYVVIFYKCEIFTSLGSIYCNYKVGWNSWKPKLHTVQCKRSGGHKFMSMYTESGTYL